MKICWGLLLLFVVCCGAEGDALPSTTTHPITTPSANTTTTHPTTTPSASTTTTHPTTTPSADTTTTHPTTTPSTNTTTIHPTTTPSANTTTTHPTTTPSANTTTTHPTTPSANTTTPQPTTTTTSQPTTTSKPVPPAPVPAPEANHWSLNITGTNRTCLVLNVAAQIEMYIDGTNLTEKINIPIKNVTYNGTCKDQNHTSFTIMWQSNSSNANYSVNFEFGRLNNTKKYDISNITAEIKSRNASNVTTKFLYHNKNEFAVTEDHSYKCAKVQTLNFTDSSSNKTIGWLHVSHLQYQAFVNRTDDKFESAWDCEGSGINSDVVPIVVGCVLMVLILVILAAYIIGRRRWNARGYLSMFAQERNESDYIPMKNMSCFS